MIRTTGKIEEYTPVKVVNEEDNLYLIRFDKQDNEDGTATWMEEMIRTKPTELLAKNIISDYYNEQVDNAIIGGMTWKEMPIWLSMENQMNYKAAYDLAVQTNGSNLPLVFKFGDEFNPVYHTFETLDDLRDFYTSAFAHVMQCYKDGWAKKDSIDYSVYNVS